jgi:CBS domain-containing protein
MTTARDIMTRDCQCVPETANMADAARMMRELDVGALPICSQDDRLLGMLTDRDIVVNVVADGLNPAEVSARALAKGTPICVEGDTPVEDVMQTMADRQIRRVPVIENKRLVGIISQADIARATPNAQTGSVVEQISS